MSIMYHSYQEDLSQARRENPSRKKEDFIDVEFWDAPDENHQLTDQKKLEPQKDNGVV